MGSLTRDIAKRAGVRLLGAHRLDLVVAEDAVRFLESCQQTGVLVLGVEVFRVLDNRVEPDMSAIADVSGLTDPQQSVVEARRFLADVTTPDLASEFTLVGPDEAVYGQT